MSFARSFLARDRVSKLLVYLLIAPLFTVFQGVVAPIEKANAAYVFDALGNSCANNYSYYGNYDGYIQYGPVVTAGTSTTIRSITIAFNSPTQASMATSYIQAYEVNQSTWDAQGTPTIFQNPTVSGSLVTFSGSLNTVAGQSYAFHIKATSNPGYSAPQWYYCETTNNNTNGWVIPKSGSNFRWVNGYNTVPTSFTYPTHIPFAISTDGSSAQTITYAAGTDGSGSAPSSPTSVSYGSTFTTPANTYTRTGYSFAGWSDGTNTYAAGATYPSTGTVSGNVALTATWTANTQTITFNSLGSKTLGDSNFDVTATSSSGLAVTITSATPSVCTITGNTVTIVNVGTCTLKANQTGNSFYLSASEVQQSFAISAAVPGAPTNVSSTAYENAQSVVSWTAPSANGSAITSYTVTSSPGNKTCTTSTTSCTVTGLTNGTAYTFTVTATNGAGTGSASSASSAIEPNTGDGLNWYSKSQSGASAGLSRSSVTSTYTSCGKSTTINYNWGNGATSCLSSYLDNFTNYWQGYIVAPYSGSVTFYNSSDDGFYLTIGSTNVITNWVDQGSQTYNSSGSITLVKGQVYSIQIWHHEYTGGAVAKLFWEYSGQSVTIVPQHYLYSSNPAGATTPAAPTIDSITPGNGTLSVAFTSGDDGGATITNYEYSTDGGSSWTTPSPTSTSSPISISGLANGTSYSVKIRAVNSAGSGTASSATSGTPRTVPGAPTGVSATSNENTQSVISWSAPSSTGGSAITGYTVTSTPSVTAPAGCTNTLNLSCTFTGLTNGTSYTFTVTATNAAGTGSASSASSAAVPATTPGAPTTVLGTAGNTQVALTWTAPGSTGGAAISGYKVEYSSNSGSSWSTATSNTGSATASYTVTGLTNLSTYIFKVSAINGAGTGSASSNSSSIIPGAQAPTISSQPTGATKTVGQGITFSVTASVTDNGTISYQWKKDGSNVGTNSSSYTISSISSGDAGTYTVVVSNSKNSTINSTTSSSATLTIVGAPSAPQNVAFSNVGVSAGSLKLTWDTPSSDGGSAITAYEYRYSLNAEESWSAWTSPSPSDTRTVTITGLSNQKSYKAQVRAKNAYGTSAATATSAAVTTTGDVATALGAPTITGVTNGDATNGGKLTIAFTDPTVSGSANAITGYQYSTDSGVSWKTVTVTPGSSSFTISAVSGSTSNLVNGTSYTVLLRVVNAAGPGTASTGVAGTPSKVPGIPTGVSLSLGTSSGTMVLAWTAPSDNGGLSLTYEYRYKLTSSSSWGDWTSGGSGSSVTISGISNGNTYDAQVRAKNSTGAGTESATSTLNAVFATGPSITTQPSGLTLTVGQTTGTTLSVTASAGSGETLSYQWQKASLTDTNTVWSNISGATNSTYTVTTSAILGDAAKFRVIVTGSKSGASSNVSAKINAWGPDASICNAPNYNTFYYGNRFYAGTADTVKEFQLQVPANSNLTAISGMKIRFYTYDSTTKMFFPASWSGVNANELPSTTLGDLTYATYSDRTITFRGNVTLPSAGNYWWVVVNTSTTNVSFCNSNNAETTTDGWYLYKESSSWVWYGNFRKSIEYGKFLWSTHPNFRLYSATTTTTSSANTTSSEVTVNVNNAPTITTSTVPGATKGSAYSTTLALSGGTAPYSWVLANGSSLPSGLSLSTSGVISGTPTALSVNSSSSSSSSGSSLKNGDFSATFVNTPAANSASGGWYNAVRVGGPTVINTVGKNLQFSYGPPACTTQSTVPMSEVRQTVLIPTAGPVTFKVKVKNDTWNRIGFGYSNPCYDPYQVTITSSGGQTATTGRRIPTTTTGNYVNENVELTITTNSANQLLTISLFGLDAGYWAGNYGPIFSEASLSTPDSSSSNSSSSATSGSTTFTVEVTDANGIKTTKTLTFSVASDISITTKTLGNANKGASYTQALTASGGSSPITWSLVTGTLPSGLSLNTSTGVISGTVSSTATSQSITIRATDANSASVDQSYTINVLSGVPAAPTSLTLGTIGNGTVPLTWTLPTDNGGSVITNYIISYASGKGKTDDQEDGDDHEEDEDKGSVSVSATGLTFPYSLTGLKNGRTYTITVSAKNANATSVASNSVTAVPAKTAGAPQSLSLILSNGGITIRWKKPSDTGGLKVSSYQVQCRKSTDADIDGNWIEVSGRQDTNSEKVYSLILDTSTTGFSDAKGKSYFCRVRQVSTKNGSTYNGAWATSTNPVAFVSVPSSPSITTVDTTTATTKVTVTFNQSTDDGGSTITSYIASVVKKKDSGEDEDEKRTCSVNKPNSSNWSAGSLNCTINGVPTKGSFNVEVVAVNSAGQSNADTRTVTILGKTQALTYPNNSGIYNSSTKTYTKYLSDSDFSIGVTVNSGLKLKYSVDNNKCTITSKGLIKIKEVGLCKITITQSGKADDDDDDDSNNKSDSDWEPISGTSQYVYVNILPVAPSVPSWVSVTPGDQTLVAKWNAPKAPNNTVTDYTVKYNTSPVADCADTSWIAFTHTASTSTTMNITGLSNGTAYYLCLIAVNSTSSSNAVVTPASYTPAGVPSKPTISSTTSYPDTSTVLINWSSVAGNGASVTSYTVTGTATGQSNVTCTTGSSATSCLITGVKNKNTYSFTMVARNSIGTSSTSDSVTVTVDGISQSITLNTTPAGTGWNVGDPDLQLDASSTSGLPLQYSSSTTSICTVSSGGMVHFVSNGTCNITIKQDGTNSSSGNGAATRYSAATDYGPIQLIVSPAKPSAPVITSVTNNASGLIIVWSAPSSGGGSITYTITGTASGKANETCTTSDPTRTCTIAVASKGTQYGFTAVANNGVDSSTASSVVYGTWQVAPSAPLSSGTSSGASATDGKAIDIYWNKSSDDGGSAIIRYTASAVNGGTTKSCQVSNTGASSYNCSITGLTPGTSYTVSVTATNSIGTSSALSIGSITPGRSQTITLSSDSSTVKTYGDADFQIVATVDSGQSPSYAASGSACSVSSTGLVHILAVGSCTVTISQAGGGTSEYLAATNKTVSVTVNNGTPSKAIITKAAPSTQSIILAWTAPSFTGGSSLSYVATAVNGGSSHTCNTTNTYCTISGLTDNVDYSITVVATNQGSLSSTSDAVTVAPYTNARAPMPLTATGGNKSTTHTWQAPTEYSGTLKYYKVYYRVAGSGSSYTVGITTSDTATVSGTISGLADNTRYEFYATAWVESATVLSEGNATSVVFATTLNVPSAPQGVSGTSTYVASGNTATASINWSAPSSNGGSPITGYTVTATAGASTGTCTTSGTSCSITGLSPGTSYSVTVIATNAVGNSPASSSATVVTVAPASAPTGVSAIGNSQDGKVTVNWTVPTDNGGTPITSYIVTAYQSGSATSYTCTIAGAASTSCVFTGLPYKTAYTFKVSAVTSAGAGTPSDASNEITLTLSQAITFTSPGNIGFNTGSVNLNGVTDSGLAITYTSTSTSVCTVSGAVVSFVTIGACSITAAQAGDDRYTAATSVPVSFNITAVVPSAVTLLQVSPGASKLTVTWTQATDLGGSTLKHYVLSWATKTDFSDEQSTTTSSYQNVDITGLDANTAYIVRVAVVTNDSSENSAWSNRLSATTFGLPDAPVIGSASSSSAGIATVTWTDVPSNKNGGTPITGYTVEAFAVDGSTLTATGITCSIGSSVQSCTLSGLSGATYYKFKVTATNAVGSATSDPTATAIRPGQAQTLSISNVSTRHSVGTVVLTGTSTSGLPLLYSVLSETPANSTSSSWGNGRNVCVVDSSGNLTVDLGGTCVVAINQDGTSTGNNGDPTSYLPAAQETMTVTVAVDVPSITAEFNLTAGNGEVTATWNAPENDGGAPITAYVVTWFVKDNRPVTFTTGGTSNIDIIAGVSGRQVYSVSDLSSLTKTITELVNGTTYTIYVQAINSAGAGPES